MEESQKAKIAMYVKRPFGEKMNATFGFISENWKPLLKYTTFLLLPLCFIQALTLNGLMGGALDAGKGTMVGTNPIAALGVAYWTNYGLTMLCYLIGYMIQASLVYALMKIYNEREERVKGITFIALRPLLFSNLGRMLKLLLFGIGIGIVVTIVLVLLTMLTPFTLILTIPLVIACVIPVTLMTPIYLFEDITLISAFKKTFHLGFATWGGIFLLSLVLNIIAGILQGITMLPWYIATIVKYFFAMSDAGSTATISPIYSFFLYILGIIQGFGMYVSMIIIYVGIAYQYGHASEVVDSVSVEEDIDNFEKL